MPASANICPVCQHKNPPEDVVCARCGAALDDPFMDPGARTKTTDMPAVSPELFKGWSVDENVAPEGAIAIFIEGEARPTHIESKAEFIIGRKVGATSDVSLDLSPQGAYHMGLSRRHAVIRRTEQGYEILDLGSVNGTWLNHERLAPHRFYPLASNSHLRLGNMRLLVIYRPVLQK